MMIRVGNKVINLDNVMRVDLDWEGEGHVVFEFVMRGGSDELDGESIATPYLQFFYGEQAEAIRRYFEKSCPDLTKKPAARPAARTDWPAFFRA
jgi:hypothetical protein